MKKIALITAAAVMFMFTGCQTTLNDNTANWVGMTFHQAYTKIAEKQDAQFKADVEALWVEIDKVDTVEGLTGVYVHVADKIDGLIQKKELTTTQKTIITVMRKYLDKAVAMALSTDEVKKSNAIAWLKKFRDGVRTMRNLEKGEASEELPTEGSVDGTVPPELTPEEVVTLSKALSAARK